MLTEAFFSTSIKLLWNTLKGNGIIYIPFIPKVVCNILTSMIEIKKLYKIEYISETDLDSSHHFLWRGSTKLLQHESFSNLMCCEQTKNNTFGKVTERQLLHY